MYPSVPVLVYGGLCLLAIFIAILLPETADEELPQTIEEANSFGIHQTYLHCIICPQRKGELTFCVAVLVLMVNNSLFKEIM